MFEHHLESSHCLFGDQTHVSFGMCPLGMMHVFLSDQHCSVNPSHMANGSGVGRTDGWTTARVNENWDVAWPIFSETRKHLVIWDGPAGMNVACPSLADQNQIPTCFTLTIRDNFFVFLSFFFAVFYFSPEAQYYNPNDYQTWVEIQWSHPLWYNRRGHRLDVKNPSMVTCRGCKCVSLMFPA